MTVRLAFEKARAEGRAALVGYVPAGFPTVAGGIAAVRALAESGADLIEVGYPYSDPVIDGPVIQRATEAALAQGVRGTDVMRTVEAAAAAGVPVLVMTYWNLVEHYAGGRAQPGRDRTDGGSTRGVGIFARDLAAAGGSGLITPDLIPDEAAEWIAVSDDLGLDRVFLVAPSSTDARIAATVAACRGFVYATSVMGVTGARETTSLAAPTLVARVRRAISRPDAVDPRLPVGVGLGVRDGDQAAEVGAYADGVIVGSALVSCLLGGDLEGGLAKLRALTADLAAGVRRAAAQRA
jgi:tryptophan synthase alpha chain